jgi:hypothetical protein
MRHLCRRAASATAAAGLLTLASPAVAAAPSYKGKVKGGGAITFQVSGGAVRHLNANVTVLCSSVDPARSETSAYVIAPQKLARIARNGTFTAKVDLKKQRLYVHGKLMDTLLDVKATVKGTIKGRSSSGTAKVTYGKMWMAYNPGTGFYVLTLAQCWSNTVKWSAKH